MNLPVVAWSVVALITLLRLAFAASLPLTGDEAYYWEWSRRLAAGYADHPPAVAFAIAAFSWLGRTPFAVRIAFVLCGLGTAIATGGAATILARDKRAGAIAALAVTLAPIMTIAFGTASPDGPYALAWALTLYFAVRALRQKSTLWFALLGGAMGFALLSRVFALLLVFGIAGAALSPQYRESWRRGLWLSFVIALMLYAPFIAWNASHHWISFAFAFLQRHPGGEVQLLRPLSLYALSAIAFSPGLWIAVTIALLRPKEPIVTWTALPLAIVFFVVALHERVEVYWFDGPYISLCVALGCERPKALGWIFTPAAVLSALVFAAAIAPFALYSALQKAGLHLSDAGPFEMFTYGPLARDAGRIANANGSAVMTDGYGFSSLLDFYGDVKPLVIGYDAQGEEARKWVPDTADPSRALFIDKVPLQHRADFERQFALSCGRVAAGPTLHYRYRSYYTTWCEEMKPGALAMLRWSK